MGNIFSLDSKFNQFMTKVFNLMMLNFIFIIMCIPIFTIGANFTALYYVTLKMAKGDDPYIWRNYWKSFRQNFRQATAIWLILLIPLVLIIGDLFFVNVLPSIAQYLKFVFWFLLIVMSMVLSYVFPVLSRFDNTVKQTIKNSALMSIRHLPWTACIVAINLAPIIIYAFAESKIAAWMILFMLLLGFSTVAFGCSWFFANKVFPWYMPAEEEELSEEDDIAHAIDALDGEDTPSESANETPEISAEENETSSDE